MRLLFSSIRERIGAAVVAVIAAMFFCMCGVVFVFFLAPRQALEARRIGNISQMDGAGVVNAPAGTDILITGRLTDNPTLDGDLVAYRLETWQVRESSSDDPDINPSGSWNTSETNVPNLTLDVNGQALTLLADSNVSLSGSLHEEIRHSDSSLGAEDFDDNWIPDGSQRFRGLQNGDLTTVLGTKASTGGVIPDKLYVGDRVAFEESEKEAASGFLVAGICMLVLAPVTVIGGILGTVFGRRRNRGLNLNLGRRRFL